MLRAATEEMQLLVLADCLLAKVGGVGCCLKRKE